MLPNNNISPTKWAWLWSRDCLKILPFAMMQCVAWVRQQQRSNKILIFKKQGCA